MQNLFTFSISSHEECIVHHNYAKIVHYSHDSIFYFLTLAGIFNIFLRYFSANYNSLVPPDPKPSFPWPKRVTNIGYSFLSSAFWLSLVIGDPCSDTSSREKSEVVFFSHSIPGMLCWAGSADCFYNGIFQAHRDFPSFSFPHHYCPKMLSNNSSNAAGLQQFLSQINNSLINKSLQLY